VSWLDRLSGGLTRTRDRLADGIADLMGKGPDTLIAADVGPTSAAELVEALRSRSRREDMADAHAVLSALAAGMADAMPDTPDPLATRPATVLFVGVNGTGKTTSVGKIAAEAAAAGRRVVIGSADTYRAAAIEQLAVWARRAGVPVVERERGADPAAVVFDVLALARETGADLVLVDTAGRLHTSVDLMDELRKVQRVARAQSTFPVITLLVMDATTGQNGLAQAKAFDDALDLDGVVLTKLDGTAKGGIAVAIARDLGLPIVRVGVGESLEDLHPFDRHEFARALAGVS
jgi:fused signal recognition particle receptor